MARQLFGICIDEDITWIAAEIGTDNEFAVHRPCLRGTLLNSEQLSQPINLQARLKNELEKLKAEPGLLEIFNNVCSVGVSTIGLAERNSHRLISIARKDWFSSKHNYLIEFTDVFDGVFSKISPKDKFPFINIHNDATARCIAEFYSIEQGRRPDSMFYVMISEGVNAGFVVRGWPPVAELHTEVGHILPRPHSRDFSFHPDKSGCPAHTFCFEGLASGSRIRKSWGGRKLVDLKEHEDDPWHRISYYIAQLCMTGVLALSPEQIIIGGDVVFPDLIKLIRMYFITLNSGGRKNADGTPRAYLRYDSLDNTDFIRMGQIRDFVGERGALELARLAVQAPQRALPPRTMKTKHRNVSR